MKKNEWITLIVGIVVIIFFAWTGGVFSLFKGTTMNQTSNNQSAIPAVSGKNISTDPKLQVIEVQEGTGAAAKNGSHVYVNYTGMFENGKVFDSSYNRGVPFDFVLGQGRVIKGWDLGLQGMKVGGKRRLVIAPDYAYGTQDVKDPQTGEVIIPANSTLTFDVELVDIK